MDRILCVDDEANVLSSLRRTLHGHFDVQTAPGGAEGLEAIENHGPFAVVVADMRMPQMDGVEFLARVRDVAPDTVRIMLTGNADMETAIRAVNEGDIFRFLTKPCPGEPLIKAISAAAELYRLITTERELLEGTLKGSIKVLTDVLSLINPAAFGQAARLRHYVRHVTEQLGLTNAWQFEVAAMLSQIGCVTLPGETVAKISAGRELSHHEKEMFASHPAAGAKLIGNIPRLEGIAEMIAGQLTLRGQNNHCEEDVNRDNVAIGTQMLKVALEFDNRINRGIPPYAALAQMRGMPQEYDPRIVAALENVEVKRAAPKARAALGRVNGSSLKASAGRSPLTLATRTEEPR